MRLGPDESIHMCMDKPCESPDTWIDAGLSALVEQGHEALKAKPLADVLGVSRGSFYWHFSNLAAFHRAILERWRALMLEQIIARVERSQEARLEHLLKRALSEPSRLEVSVRAWALVHDGAAAMVAEVDKRRIAYLTALIEEAGAPPHLSAARAQILNWVFLGYALSGDKVSAQTRALLVAELLGFAEHEG